MLLNASPKLHGQHPRAIPRNDPSGFYNCHGLVFASRRSIIYDHNEIHKILEEDCYREVHTHEVLPGDIVLYLSDKGDPEHSGIVISKPSEHNLRIPCVLSKWGPWKEVIHLANDSPYDFTHHKYYRVAA